MVVGCTVSFFTCRRLLLLNTSDSLLCPPSARRAEVTIRAGNTENPLSAGFGPVSRSSASCWRRSSSTPYLKATRERSWFFQTAARTRRRLQMGWSAHTIWTSCARLCTTSLLLPSWERAHFLTISDAKEGRPSRPRNALRRGGL